MKNVLDGYNISFDDPGENPTVDLSGLNETTKASDSNSAFSKVDEKVEEVGKGATSTLRTVIGFAGVIALLIAILGMVFSKRKRDEGKEEIVSIVLLVVLAFAAVTVIGWAMGIGASF